MLNKNTARLKSLPPHLRKIVEGNTEEDLFDLCGALQGGIISYSMTTKQKSLFDRLKVYLPHLENINNEWDFVCHKTKMYIDSKSPSYDNNTPVENTAKKYLDANKTDYEMYFVITGKGSIKWPIAKYKKLGINIVTELEMKEIIDGKTK